MTSNLCLPIILALMAVSCAKSEQFRVIEPLKASHRGIISVAPENTDAAIKASIGIAQIVDLDIIVTKFGDIVCAHDERLNELDPKQDNRLIREMTRAEIKAIDIGTEIPYERDGGIKVQKYATTHKYAFLDEVFDLYIDDIIFWLDVKNRSLDYAMDIRVIDEFLHNKVGKLDRVIVSSTNPLVVVALAEAAKKNSYFDRLTIGLDYGEDLPAIPLAIFESAEEKMGFNFRAIGRNLVTQEMIDSQLSKNSNYKFLLYPYKPGDTPEFGNIYAYLIEFLQP